MWDSSRLAVMMWLMQQVADNKSFDRVGPVETEPAAEDVDVSSFVFTCKAGTTFAGQYRIIVQRLDD